MSDKKQMINADARKRIMSREDDFVAKLIKSNCTTGEGKEAKLNPSLICDLAERNNCPEKSVKGQRAKIGTAGSEGRIRMTVSNMLRARALRRHGLYDLNGTFRKAPEDFIGDHEKTETKDGEKIAKPKPAADKKAA